MHERRAAASPLWWVPSAYFSMGLAYVTLTNVTAILFKNTGMDNGRAAEYASYFILAYTIKPLFSPFVEMYKTKKFFVLCAQVAIGIGFGAAALLMRLPQHLVWLLMLFWVISFLGSTQDIATDGVYITSLSGPAQSLYSGVASLSWNSAPIVASGGLVYLSGKLHTDVFHHDPAVAGPDWLDAWRVVFVLIAFMCLVFPIWHARVMPPGAPAANTPRDARQAWGVIQHAFVTFFQKPGIGRMVAFAFFYRLSVGLLEKVGAFFMVDPVARGGLGLGNEMLGLIYGTYGLLAVLVGALLGGWFVARRGVRATLPLLCFAVNVPNVTFLLLAIYQPHNLALVTAGVVVEKFCVGFGMVGFVIYLMQQLAPGPYMTTHYAFATGLMGLCMMLTGIASGHLQQWLGYRDFFILVMLATIPSFVVSWRAPFHQAEALQR